MTLEEWYLHPDYRRELKEALELPCVVAALGIIRRQGRPTPVAKPDGVGYLEWNACQNARREGYTTALENLEALTKPLVPRKKLPEAWESEQPDR